ncbi:MAG: hypothetical protein H0T42_15495 [Deltaproteobacteria bacterium]|nr:hypothetical protein [Deltaproteobacteria bacterium]
MRSIHCLAVAVFALVGCGDDGAATPDAAIEIDAPLDAPAPPAGCDYGELQDATNDDLATPPSTAETTGKTLATSITLCGQLDSTHYNATNGLVDIDGFAVTLPAGPVRVTVSGPGLEAMRDVTLEISEGANFADLTDRQILLGTHVYYMSNLDAGLYQFAIQAGNATALTAPLTYKIVITVDDPASRCPKITAAPNHTEGLDTATTSNDVIDRDFSPAAGMPPETLTPAVSDNPEVTPNGTINPTTTYRITATLAEATVAGGYKDRDTFAFTTGAATDQVSIRVNWAGAADLDMYLFPAAVPSIAGSSVTSSTEGEFRTFAVKPSTTYWVWTGLYRTSTGPQPYDISVCGSDFVHPSS